MGLSVSDRCMNQVVTGIGLGAGIGGCFGIMYGGYEALAAKLPMSEVIRHTSRTAMASASLFGFFLAVGSGLRCDHDPELVEREMAHPRVIRAPTLGMGTALHRKVGQ